ncbi:hypothetical protein WJX77_004896 [Trebouxia sp. C0004]
MRQNQRLAREEVTNCTFDRGLLTEQKRNMSCTALWELLIRELGQEDAIRFSDVHLQNLIDKGYTDHGALKDATCDGLQSPPPLLPALVDKLLKCFKPAGRLAGALYEGGSAPSKKAKTGFQHERVRTDDSNSYFVVNERLLLVGEDNVNSNKAMREGIKAATDDLRKKSISLAESHYGSLSYILAYAASGFDCESHLMNTGGEVEYSRHRSSEASTL